MATKSRNDVEVRLLNADYGKVDDDGLEYLNYSKLPAPDVSALTPAQYLFDIALSLRRIVIQLDAIRRGIKT